MSFVIKYIEKDPINHENALVCLQYIFFSTALALGM